MAVMLASGQVEGELRMNNLYGGLGLCMKLLLLFNLRSAIGIIPQKLVFCNSDLDKSTTVCKIGDLTRLA